MANLMYGITIAYVTIIMNSYDNMYDNMIKCRSCLSNTLVTVHNMQLGEHLECTNCKCKYDIRTGRYLE